ncbi:MAG: biosynthetic arginine decarboxylase [Verrucomicrobiae bacterium]|nr:biosynthetic arginine decarboxylase [Verrucomicrobiae bacterium]
MNHPPHPETKAPAKGERAAWNYKDAIELYHVDHWGGQYFTVNDKGNVEVRPLQQKGSAIDMMAVVGEAKKRGLGFPLLVRFQDILRNRVEQLNESFRASILEHGFTGQYKGVFPIKVNQLREVVEEILEAGEPYHFGVEVGSKPEIFAGLAMHRDPESLIVCNGYKDPVFIRQALMGRKLGKSVILIVEKLEELRLILTVAKEMNVEPWIGIRVRLQAKGAGKWATSGGEHAKFGLSTPELLEACEMLKRRKLNHCFKLLHFHIGSQIPDILTIKKATREAARYYAKLHQIGFPLEFIDVGGGLGVDYDGSGSTYDSSINYTLKEYTSDVIYNIKEVCDAEKVPHPNVVSESGRALVAHHSVLLVNVFGAIEKAAPETAPDIGEKEHKLVLDLQDIKKTACNGHALQTKDMMEAFHDAAQIKEDVQSMFDLGLVDLKVKAKVENLYWEICREIYARVKENGHMPDEIAALEIQLSDQFMGNFSIFQSLIDHWAVGQMFPIMPIHKLDQKPDRTATIVDITCDSDGKIKKFIGHSSDSETIPLHDIQGNEPYYLGFFFMGAYQDIMGDLHNLFGRVNELHVFLDPDEPCGYYIEDVIKGNTISDVLALTQYHESELSRAIKTLVDAAIKSDRLIPSEGIKLLEDYEKGLKEYTYLNFGK